jgi:4-diphosphocytidyl-2-C-methyl-D-erythritol kinase
MNLPLTARAPAKINLGLFLGPRRPDGRHELVTVMQSISLADELTLCVAAAGGPAASDRRLDGGQAASDRRLDSGHPLDGGERRGDAIVCPGVPGEPGENLAARALAAFRAATGWEAGPLELRIDKRVPVAAGLGGGSGDAAAALRLAAAASGLGGESLLLELARDLGADVPAQVSPGRWLARGAGELLQGLADPEAALGVLVSPSAAGLSTAAVYAQADRMGLVRSRAVLKERGAALARALAGGAALPAVELLENDLQEAACALCPEIDVALGEVRVAGADVALLSGSGPTVLGLFVGPGAVARARTAAARLAGAQGAVGAPAPAVAEPVGVSFAAVRDLTMRHNSRR